jgi:hypothetical protein
LGSNLANNINDSNACRGPDGEAADCKIDELLTELPGIAVNTVLQTIGNGFLSDMHTVFQIAEKFGRKEPLDATDFVTLAGVGIRLGCSVLTLAVPVAAVGCNIASALTSLAINVNLTENPIFGNIVKDIGNVLHNNPIVKAIVPAFGRALHDIGKTAGKILRPIAHATRHIAKIPRMVADNLNVIASMAAGIFGIRDRKVHRGRGKSVRKQYRSGRKQQKRRR